VAAIPRDTGASRQGERHLSPDELAAFWRWLEPRTCHASRVLLLQIATGQRVQMLAGLGDRHYSATERLLEWSVAETKRRDPHVLPLPRAACEVIDRLPRGPLFFPQLRNPSRPVTHFTVADLCRAYCAEAGVQPFTPRDVRRTWKTLAGLAGLDKEIRDRLQHHAMHDVGSRHYDRYSYLREKRAAMARWSAWLDRLLGQPDPQVLPFVGSPPRNIAQ
jgi:integrase